MQQNSDSSPEPGRALYCIDYLVTRSIANGLNNLSIITHTTTKSLDIAALDMQSIDITPQELKLLILHSIAYAQRN
jgi:hypothetical protein